METDVIVNEEREYRLVDNTAWLDGAAAFEQGYDCPWDYSGRLGWLAAQRDKERER